MALTLSKTGISNGGTIQASHVTQSVDALTGTIAYDIKISGSLALTGSVGSVNGFTGSLSGNASSATAMAGYYIPSGSGVAIVGNMRLIAGASKTGGTPPYIATVTVSPADLTGRTLNQSLFVATAPSQSGATVSATLNGPNSITFVSNNANTDFTFIATYL